MDGGPPVRGTLIKQSAGFEQWRTLPQRDLLPEVRRYQLDALDALRRVQKAICVQVAQGVVETLGVSAWPAPESDGVWVGLPPGTDIAEVARAIVAEGAEARPDAETNYLLLPVQPWFDMAEIDQTILCCAKVVHVMLGIHPPGTDVAQHLAEGSACHVNFRPVVSSPQAEPKLSLSSHAD